MSRGSALIGCTASCIGERVKHEICHLRCSATELNNSHAHMWPVAAIVHTEPRTESANLAKDEPQMKIRLGVRQELRETACTCSNAAQCGMRARAYLEEVSTEEFRIHCSAAGSAHSAGTGDSQGGGVLRKTRSKGAVSGANSTCDQRPGADGRIQWSKSRLKAHLWGILWRHRPVVVCAAYAELLDADIVSADIVQTVDQHIKAELVSGAHVHAATRFRTFVKTRFCSHFQATRLRAHLLQTRGKGRDQQIKERAGKWEHVHESRVRVHE